MKIVNIFGGLGNQMFQYAFAVVLQQKYPSEEVMVDTQLYKFPIVKTYKGNNFYHNGFEIQKVFPNANIPIATFKDVARFSYYIPNYIINRALRKILPLRASEFVQSSHEPYIYNADILDSGFSYFEGYWFSPQYFDSYKDQIREAFKFEPFESFENIEIAKKISSQNSVSIHIRRGDYLNDPLYKDICSLDYYQRAIIEVKKKIASPSFYIFSNDLDWCRTNLKDSFGDNSVVFVSHNKGAKSYLDMQLMSLARCNVLANSSFSWWGAYLNNRRDHFVIAPKIWVNIPSDDVYCQDWIRV